MSISKKFTVESKNDNLKVDNINELLMSSLDTEQETNINHIGIIYKHKNKNDPTIDVIAAINAKFSEIEGKLNPENDKETKDVIKSTLLRELNILKIQLLKEVVQDISSMKEGRPHTQAEFNAKINERFNAVTEDSKSIATKVDSLSERTDLAVKALEGDKKAAAELIEKQGEFKKQFSTEKSAGGKVADWMVKAVSATTRTILALALPIVIHGVGGIALGLIGATISSLASGGTLPVVSSGLLVGFAAAGGLAGAATVIGRGCQRKSVTYSWSQIGKDAVNDATAVGRGVKTAVIGGLKMFGLYGDDLAKTAENVAGKAGDKLLAEGNKAVDGLIPEDAGSVICKLD